MSKLAAALLSTAFISASSIGPIAAGTAGTTPVVSVVTFPGEGLALQAVLHRPPGPGPFPAVVALHGCGGLYGRSGALSPRHADWAERLSTHGFAVLFPDSFGSRDAGSQCRKHDRITRPSRERVADALAAKAYLQSRPDIEPTAISLLGWSNGGSTVLHAVRADGRARSGPPAFAKAVALYPGCRVPLERGDWHARLPLLILIGEADDWTPAEPCKTLAENAEAAGEPVSIVTYAGAYHDFDHPDRPVRSHDGLAYTATGSGTAHTGTDPKARADALKRVAEFLAS